MVWSNLDKMNAGRRRRRRSMYMEKGVYTQLSLLTTSKARISACVLVLLHYVRLENKACQGLPVDGQWCIASRPLYIPWRRRVIVDLGSCD